MAIRRGFTAYFSLVYFTAKKFKKTVQILAVITVFFLSFLFDVLYREDFFLKQFRF